MSVAFLRRVAIAAGGALSPQSLCCLEFVSMLPCPFIMEIGLFPWRPHTSPSLSLFISYVYMYCFWLGKCNPLHPAPPHFGGFGSVALAPLTAAPPPRTRRCWLHCDVDAVGVGGRSEESPHTSLIPDQRAAEGPSVPASPSQHQVLHHPVTVPEGSLSWGMASGLGECRAPNGRGPDLASLAREGSTLQAPGKCCWLKWHQRFPGGGGTSARPLLFTGVSRL